MECFFCGVSDREERLMDAVSGTGIVKICQTCEDRENLPIVRKPTTFQLKESEKKDISFKQMREEAMKFHSQRPKPLNADTTLRALVDRNYRSRVPQKKRPRPDLVDNFHWIIMRARRLRKLTAEQLAKEISESEAAIKMAEEGILPEDDYRLINKLESFLSIRLRKTQTPMPERESPARIIKFDPHSTKVITIDKLRKMKEIRERELLESDQEEENMENIHAEEPDVDEERMDDIIFKRK